MARHYVAALGATPLAFAAIALAACNAFAPVQVTVHNRTSQTLEPMSVVVAGQGPSPVPAIAAGRSAVVPVEIEHGGEHDMQLAQGSGRSYVIVGYFEGGHVGGHVSVTIRSVDASGALAGQVVNSLDSPGMFASDTAFPLRVANSESQTATNGP